MHPFTCRVPSCQHAGCSISAPPIVLTSSEFAAACEALSIELAPWTPTSGLTIEASLCGHREWTMAAFRLEKKLAKQRAAIAKEVSRG